MLTYSILENGNKIGIARGKHAAFEFVQKEIDRQGLTGYWAGDRYISKENINYSMEVCSE